MSSHSQTLNDVVAQVPKLLAGNLVGVSLFGSAARANGLFEGWSDIDIIFVVNEVTSVSKTAMREHLNRISRSAGIGFSVVLLSDFELRARFERISPFNSVLLNAVSGRPQCGRVVWGDVPFKEAEYELERANAASYLDHGVQQIRRALLESKGGSPRAQLAQLIRWTASYLRAWLRLHRIFVLPYEPSIGELNRNFPQIETAALGTLFELRRNWQGVTDDACSERLPQLDAAFESFVSQSIRIR